MKGDVMGFAPVFHKDGNQVLLLHSSFLFKEKAGIATLAEQGYFESVCKVLGMAWTGDIRMVLEDGLQYAPVFIDVPIGVVAGPLFKQQLRKTILTKLN